MSMARREFLKGGLAALGFMALDGLPVFAAPTGWKPARKPNLVFGILSDTHQMIAWDGVSPHSSFPLTFLSNAFKLFKERKIDAFLHLGDAAHRGVVRELEFHRECLQDVFGKNGGPVKLLVAGNHEYFGHMKRIRTIWPDEDDWAENAIRADVPRHWERAWGEKYEPVWHREVKGYHFFGRHWGVDEIELSDFINSKADELGLGGTKPFFILSHIRHHFKFCQALREFPNAVAFFGHWHQSNADWKSIYFDKFGGFFPSIECGACRAEDGGNDLAHDLEGDDEKDGERNIHNNRLPSRQAMIVNVYDDMVVFERHEVSEGGKLGPDWVMPLGQYEPHPFKREELERVIGSPEFSRSAKLTVKKVADGVAITIPLADGNKKSRVYAYDVSVTGDSPHDAFSRSVYFEGVNLGVGHEPNHGDTMVEIPKSELPKGRRLNVAVRPVSSLGTAGKPITTKWNG